MPVRVKSVIKNKEYRTNYQNDTRLYTVNRVSVTS